MDENNKLALIVSYYLSRFDTLALERLGYSKWNQAIYDIGKRLDINPNTIKNMRDDFDPLHPNKRVGWYQRELRPSRREIKEQYEGYTEEQLTKLVKNILNNYKGHFINLDSENLKYEDLLLQEAIDFINTIKNTSMSRSYKIPLLLAFYNNGDIKLKIDEDDIYNSFKKFYSNKENAKDLQGQKSTRGYENWGKKEYIKLAKDNPIKYLADKTSQYFYKEDDKFCLSENLQPYIHQNEFIEEFKYAIQSLENRYFKRSNSIKEDDNKYIEQKEEIIPVDIINKVENYIKNQGYNYTYNQLSNLYLSLKTDRKSVV